ncbi:MAG TPA: ATP-binding protein, partial [Candidatus Acidoferrales bacterium]|nr:ATP-binding protein [Candidatus Acidoferrales bacterium]
MGSSKIYKLVIKGYRGFQDFSWCPGAAANVILGGGDVGKSTILDAIGLLLSPSNAGTALDIDYYLRDVDSGFSIEAIMSLSLDGDITKQFKPSWPWRWDGNDARVPGIEVDGDDKGEPVYRVRVRGTPDLELIYDVVQPSEDTDSFSASLRRSIGLVKLGGEDRNDRDLRLVQGSALDRLLSDKTLRSRLGQTLAESEIGEALLPEKRDLLAKLNNVFVARKLPHDLDLAITGSQGLSITALIGLTAKRQTTELPLVSWGAGTRRSAALAIAEHNQGPAPITVIDELERGLEPYRQRRLMCHLQAGSSQSFLTTHSPAVLSAASTAKLWYLSRNGVIGELPLAQTAGHRKSDPEAFLSTLTIVVEGATELGFVTGLLERAFDSSLEEYGVHILECDGNEATLALLQALASSGISFGGFADNEGNFPNRWNAVSEKLGKLLFRWEKGCIEENIVGLVPEARLWELLVDPVEPRNKTGDRRRTLATRLGLQADDKEFATISAAAGTNLKTLIVAAACGDVPEGIPEQQKKDYKAHAGRWFKSREGGRELLEKVFSLGIWPSLRDG